MREKPANPLHDLWWDPLTVEMVGQQPPLSRSERFNEVVEITRLPGIPWIPFGIGHFSGGTIYAWLRLTPTTLSPLQPL